MGLGVRRSQARITRALPLAGIRTRSVGHRRLSVEEEPMSLPSVETARDWPAKTIVDRAGDPLGRIACIYVDRVTGQATWALVVPGRLRRRPTFVPLVQAVREDDRVRVPVPRAVVRKTPSLRRRRELAQKHEAR